MYAKTRLGVVASIAVAMAASPVVAQFASPKGNWGAIENTLTDVGNTASTPTFTTYSDTNQIGQAKLSLTATHTGGTNQSQKEQRVTMTQTFSLTAGGNSVVQVPRYYNGDINFFGPAGNLSRGLNGASWRITNTGTNTVVATWDSNTPLTLAPNDTSVNNTALEQVTLPGGNYKIDILLTSNGYTRPAPADSPPAGAGVTLDYRTGFKGASTNIEAWPATAWDSRSAVSAPIGRTGFGVDGTGVDVGLLEVGRPYRNNDWSGTHPSLAGKLFIPGTIFAEATLTKYRDEHAQATASVIASDDANAANAGVAPKSTITTYATSADTAATSSQRFRNGLTALKDVGVRVINMSMTSFNINNGDDPAADNLYLDQFLNTNQNLVFVKSSGNNANGATPGATAPGTAFNCITVGGIDMTYRRRATSSFGNAALNPFKPDLVAPGQFVNAAASFGGGFTRGFTGEAFDVDNAVTGAITGTSFAAPHVSGAVALLDQYHDTHAADHDQNAKVMKAVLLNSATTGNVYRNGGGAWQQVTSVAGDGHLVVDRSLDPELGAGLLNVNSALRQYAPAEVRVADGNTNVDLNIDVGLQPFWWDHEQAVANSNVDYILTPGLSFIRGTLVWNAKNDGTLSNMSLRLYYEGNTNGNLDGFDPTAPGDDKLVAETLTTFAGSDQNVGLLYMQIPEVPSIDFQNLLNLDYGRYYVSVFDLSGDNVDYGLAVAYIPEPGIIALAIILIPLTRRRRKP